MKVLFNVNPKVAGLTAQNVHKNNQAASLAQSQTSITPASFKGAEAVKSILQAQENMRVPKTVTGIISFKGNPAKNNNQIASIASEYQGLPPEFNDMYKIGGLANVAGEASVAFQKEGMDIRTFIPYHSVYKKADGEVVKAEGKIFVYNEQDKSMKKEDPTKYTLGQGEKFVLVAGVQTDDNTPPKMLTLKPTGITGSVPYLDEVDSSLAQKEDKYALFELEREKPTDPKIYVVHTEGLAKLTKAYGSDDGGAYFSNFDREYSSFTRAIVGEILPAMSGAKKEEAKDDAAETAEENATENAVEGAEKDTVEGEVKAATEDTEKDAVEGEVEAAVEGAEKDTVEGETKDTKEEAIEEKDPSVFNPAGYWLHDRFAFPAMLEASRRAADGDNYFSGLRMHATYHNPGRDYQGHYDNPLDFIKTIGAVEILDTIAQDKPEEAKRVVNYIEQIKEYKTEGDNDPFTPMQKILTKEEYADLEKIFEPYIGQFKDEKGSYNMSLIPFVATNTNKGNFTHGTVSMNYGKEMVDLDTPEIAYGITSILKKDAANMVNITNGSYAVSLGLFKPGFGNADVLNKAEGYTWLIRGEKDQEAIFKNLQEHNKKAEEKAKKEGRAVRPEELLEIPEQYNKNPGQPITKAEDIKTVESAEDLDKVKKANAKWAINAISKAFTETKDLGESEKEKALKAAFYGDENSSSTILGSLSPYEEGDKLFFGWGRGVEQKGLPTTLEAFKQFFEDESISEETKKHTKVIIAAGTWNEKSDDWASIKRLMGEIAQLKDGKYANNIVYVNGRISNKLVACADFTVLTSRYEPCGITPLEAYSAGTPVISIATGGAPDFVDKGNTGFLTEHAFFTKPETLEKETGIKAQDFEKITDPKEKSKAIDDYRIKVLGKETKDCIVKALAMDDEKYKEMAFKCFNQKVEWDENKEYNGKEKSANERYFTEAFGVAKTAEGFKETSAEAHPTKTLNALTGAIRTKDNKDAEKVRRDLAFEELRQEVIKTRKPKGDGDGKKKMSTGAKVATGVGIAAVLTGIGLAIKKFFGGKDKKAEKAGSKKTKTPKAPKPSTAKTKTAPKKEAAAAKTKIKTEASAVQQETKKEVKDFSKYLK